MQNLILNENSIAYKHKIANNFNKLTVIFHHGFMSDMLGIKSQYIEEFCASKDINFICYDNYGCGSSSGDIIDQTMTSWLEAGRHIVKQLVAPDNEIIHVGSSLGGWLATLLALNSPRKIRGVVNIAGAFDFTEKLVWQNLPQSQKSLLQEKGIIYLKKQPDNPESFTYPITLKLIEDAKQYLLLHSKTVINFPVHLIHGMQDQDVPYHIANEFIEKVSGNNMVLKLIKDGEHRLARPSDLQIITNSLDEILSTKMS